MSLLPFLKGSYLLIMYYRKKKCRTNGARRLHLKVDPMKQASCFGLGMGHLDITALAFDPRDGKAAENTINKHFI